MTDNSSAGTTGTNADGGWNSREVQHDAKKKKPFRPPQYIDEPTRCEPQCEPRGKCDTPTGMCNCDPGWLGDSCDEREEAPLSAVPKCLPEFCAPHGTCGKDDGRCRCERGWRGADCMEALEADEGAVSWSDEEVPSTEPSKAATERQRKLLGQEPLQKRQEWPSESSPGQAPLQKRPEWPMENSWALGRRKFLVSLCLSCFLFAVAI